MFPLFLLSPQLTGTLCATPCLTNPQRRALWRLSLVFSTLGSLENLSVTSLVSDPIRPSYAAISWKNFVSFSLSRAGTDDGFISGNLLKNDN